MRIGIYADVARDAKPTGIGLHVRELVRALADVDTTNQYLLYYPSRNGEPVDAFPDLQLEDNFRARPVRFPQAWQWDRPRIWWQWYLPWILRRDRIDVFHGPNHVVPHYRRGTSVVTIHDLAYFRMSVHGNGVDASLRAWTKKALDWSHGVIALSDNTRQDVVGLGIPAGKVRVIYGGGNVVPDECIQVNRVPELRASLELPERFVLFVGTIQPRKNVPFLVRAFARLKQSQALPHKLVLAGHRDSAAGEVEDLARTLGVANDIIITGYVDSWQLPLLYKLADVFVLPTLYEGFTLVTLEAMAYGTPVIATDTSSIREGVGDAAELVPLNDEVILAETLRRVLLDADLRNGLISRGRERAKMFTWRRCAERTCEFYSELAARRQARPSSTNRF